METQDGPNRVVIGFVILCVLVVGLIVLIVMGLTGNDEPETITSPTTAISASHEPTDEGESIYAAACGYEPVDRAKPDATFATTRLQTDSGVSVASAQGIGPCTLNPVPSGYAFTPKGALLAAVNFLESMTAHPNKSDVAQYQLADTVTRQEILDGGELVTGSQEPVTVVGFKTELVNSFEYRVDVAFTSPGLADRVFAVTVAVVWEDHDWRIVMPEGGPSGYPVTDLSVEGFQVWGY